MGTASPTRATVRSVIAGACVWDPVWARSARGGVQKAEAGGGSRRRGEEVTTLELHATLFRGRMGSMAQGSAGGLLSKVLGFFFSKSRRY
jgi:hypothetical protein